MRIESGAKAAALAAQSAIPEAETPAEEEAQSPPTPARPRARGSEVARAHEGGPRPTPGNEGPRGHGVAAGRIPKSERHLAAPQDLVFVDRYGNETPVPAGREPRADGYFAYRRGDFQLTREAAAAFRAMRQEALTHGYNLRLNDAFRPDAEQARRVQHAVDVGTRDASARVAAAGTSEHRTGRAFDIGTEPVMPDGTPARRGLDWAIENAALFGINHYDGPRGERMHFSYHVR